MKRGVAVVVKNKENKILLFRRAKNSDHDSGCWENLGGGLEGNENFEEAAMREAKEEAGVSLKIIKEIYRDIFTSSDNQSWETVVFEGKIDENQNIIISEEHDSFGWFTREELKTLLLASYERQDFCTHQV